MGRQNVLHCGSVCELLAQRRVKEAKVPQFVQAGLWGLLGGSALPVGAAVACLVALPQRLVAGMMAMGDGVLISAVAFDLMDETYQRGGFDSTGLGFLAGVAAHTAANIVISGRGAKHRKRSGSDPDAALPPGVQGAGLAIAVGALLDGIPGSIVIGVGLLEGTGVSLAMVAAVFLSNVPEGLSSASGMKAAGHGPAYVFGVWARSRWPRA